MSVRFDPNFNFGRSDESAFANGSTNNNFTPTVNNGLLRLSVASSGIATVTGLLSPTNHGTLQSVTCTAGTITFSHNSGSSTAANRFQFSGGLDRSIGANQSLTFIYDAISSCWRDL